MPGKHTQKAKLAAQSISPTRAARLFRLLALLAAGPKSRSLLLKRLKLDLRGFYRDLEKLRSFGIVPTLQGQRYSLRESLDQAITRLPFPDPKLNLREAMLLARGRTAAHRRLKAQIEQITGKLRR
jgi:hypothetical protein